MKLVSSRFDEKESTFLNAIQDSDILNVALCLETGVDIDAIETWKSRTGLMLAIEKYHDAIIDMLLMYGPNLYCTDNSGETAISYAITKRDIELIDKIIRTGFGINYAASGDYTALFMATERMDEELIDFLLSRGANPTQSFGAKKSAYDLVRKMGDEHPLKQNITRKFEAHWNNK